MNKKWFYMFALFIIIPLIAVYFYRKYNVAPEIDFKNVLLTNLEGQKVSLEAYKGKSVIVCFSASWCGACRKELKHLNAVAAQELSAVEILVVSDEPYEKIVTFKENSGYPFTFLKLEQAFGSYGINSIPTTYILNKATEIVKNEVGYINWKDPSTLFHIKKLIEE